MVCPATHHERHAKGVIARALYGQNPRPCPLLPRRAVDSPRESKR